MNCSQIDVIVLPGSKDTLSDLLWLKESGFVALLRQSAAAGQRIFGVCGGLQMLGIECEDENGLLHECLQLLPVRTVFMRNKPKTVRLTDIIIDNGTFGDRFFIKPLKDTVISGYEIHHGRTTTVTRSHLLTSSAIVKNTQGSECGWQRGSVIGTTVHGLFENGNFIESLIESHPKTLEETFDKLADIVDTYFAPTFLATLGLQG